VQGVVNIVGQNMELLTPQFWEFWFSFSPELLLHSCADLVQKCPNTQIWGKVMKSLTLHIQCCPI
jgi:hypothetical protein